MDLDRVVPWGRSLAEYVRMFRMDERDLGRRIVGAGDGPASFNAELHGRGGCVVSCDPIYAFGPEQIEARIAATYETIMAETRRHLGDYVWDAIPSVEELGRVRMAAMRRFLADYRTGGQEGRYAAAVLPQLPLADKSFDLALCSHLLFLYTEQLDEAFHVRSVLELVRVAREVRIFPVLDLQLRVSAHLPAVMRACERAGWRAVLEKVPYEFQRGGDQMLRIQAG